MQTEFEFELPKGYVDQNGDLHKRGTMRLATAADEILPLRDPRVQQNSGYLTIILLSRVITKLGTLSTVNTRVIEHHGPGLPPGHVSAHQHVRDAPLPDHLPPLQSAV